MSFEDLARREFLHRATASAVTILPIGLLARAEGWAGAGHQEADWVSLARAEIPATAESAYFQTGGIGPASRGAIAQVAEKLTLQIGRAHV